MGRNDFTLVYKDIYPENPSFGKVALVQWDSDTFGFPVVDYEPGPLDVNIRHKDVQAILDQWCVAHKVKLILTNVPLEADNQLWFLQEAGFQVIGTTISVRNPRLQRMKLGKPRIALRLAVKEDHSGVFQIAESAFQSGRYYEDPNFPNALASKRFGRWMMNALLFPTEEEQVWVMGAVGEPVGFFHVGVQGTTANLRLAAVDAQQGFGIAGYYLYQGVLHQFQQAGVKGVEASISVRNVAVMNLYRGLGFEFTAPKVVLHKHY